MIPLGKEIFTNFPQMGCSLVTNLTDVYFFRKFRGLEKPQIFYIFVWKTKTIARNNKNSKKRNLWESNVTIQRTKPPNCFPTKISEN